MRHEAGTVARAVAAAKNVLYLIAFPLVGLSLLYAIDQGWTLGLLFLSMCLAGACFAYVVFLAVNLFTGRFRCALSILCGLFLGILVVWNGHTIGGWTGGVQFSHERPEFDEMVRHERAQQSAPGAIRMVVKFEDKSTFALSNSSFYIIYDETDTVATAPESVRGYWRCPKSETGVINVGGDKDIKHLDGHYYSFWTTD